MEVVQYSGKDSLGSANGISFKCCGRGKALAEETSNLSATKFLRHSLLAKCAGWRQINSASDWRALSQTDKRSTGESVFMVAVHRVVNSARAR